MNPMNVRQAVGALAAIFLALIAVGSADAQTRSTRDTAMAYGARLTADAATEPCAAFTMSRDDGTHANPVDTGVGSLSQTRQRVPISGPGTFGAPENETSDISGQ